MLKAELTTLLVGLSLGIGLRYIEHKPCSKAAPVSITKEAPNRVLKTFTITRTTPFASYTEEGYMTNPIPKGTYVDGVLRGRRIISYNKLCKANQCIK